jgi:hypothetical protein
LNGRRIQLTDTPVPAGFDRFDFSFPPVDVCETEAGSFSRPQRKTSK